MLRAAWLAQELLTTFTDDLERVSLVPAQGGRFVITVAEPGGAPSTLWDRAQQKRFPGTWRVRASAHADQAEAKEIKQLLRDVIDPTRSLGHSDRKHGAAAAAAAGEGGGAGGQGGAAECEPCQKLE